MLQGTATEDSAESAPATSARRRESGRDHCRANRIRRWRLRGRQVSDADLAWLVAYEQRSQGTRVRAARREAAVDVAAAERAVGATYRLRAAAARWGRSPWEQEARRVLVWLLRQLGAIGDQIEAVTKVERGNLAQVARTAERNAAANPEVRARMDALLAQATSGRPRSWADGLIEATRKVEPGRETITVVVEVGSSLWRLLDRWAEAQEVGYLGHDLRHKPDSLAAEGARE